MKNTADFLDALRVKLDLPSDGRLADYLGMHRQHVSRYRTLGGTFDDEMSMRVADILETDPAFVVACMHHQRAKREDEKKLWQRIATTMTGIAAALAVFAILPTAQLPASEFNATFMGFTYPAMYIMSNLTIQTFALYSALCLLAVAFIMKRHHYQAKQ